MEFGFDLSKKYNRMALIIGAGVILSLLIGVLLIGPAWSQLSGLGKEVAEAESQNQQVKQDSELLKQGQEFFKKNRTLVDDVNTAVPVQPDVPQIVVMLDALAKRSQLTLAGITPQQIGAAAGGNAAVAGPASPIEITATFEGNYTSIITFFYNLERSLRIVDTKSISVSGRSGGSDEKLTGTLSFRAYYKTVQGGPQEVPAPGEAP